MDPLTLDLDEFRDPDTDESSSSDEESNDEEEELLACLMVVAALELLITCSESFQSIELSLEHQRIVIAGIGTTDVSRSLGVIPQSFKDITNFWPAEFDDLCSKVCLLIANNARIIGGANVHRGRPPKLSPQEQLLSFLLYLKHDNTFSVDAQRWNVSRSQICMDIFFVALCVNEGIKHEIRWPTTEERLVLGQDIRELRGCIGFVDGTLCKVRCPYKNHLHHKWFQGSKKMYCINTIVLVDHNGLFIYVNPGYPGSYHDSTILKNSMLEILWTQLFTHADGYCECVLGDIGYVGSEKYVMRGFSKTDIRMLGLNKRLAKVFNRMHSGYRVKVEWGIGGLKMKWKRLGKWFNLSKSKFTLIFWSAALLINFLHMRHRDMSWEIVGERALPGEGGWAGDY